MHARPALLGNVLTDLRQQLTGEVAPRRPRRVEILTFPLSNGLYRVGCAVDLAIRAFKHGGVGLDVTSGLDHSVAAFLGPCDRGLLPPSCTFLVR